MVQDEKLVINKSCMDAVDLMGGFGFCENLERLIPLLVSNLFIIGLEKLHYAIKNIANLSLIANNYYNNVCVHNLHHFKRTSPGESKTLNHVLH